MKTNKSRILCLLLAAFLCFGIFLTACGDDEESSAEASKEQSEVSLDPESEYKDANGNYVGKTSGNKYGSRVVKFLTCGVNQDHNSEIIYNEYEPGTAESSKMIEVVNRAQGDRIDMVEQLLEVEIEEEYVYDGRRKNAEMCNRIRGDNITLTADYQVVVPCLYDGATLAQEGALINLYDLPGIQMAAPWWDQVFNEEATIAEQLYFTIGDIGNINKSSTAALTFNKSLYERNKLTEKYGGLPYDLVRNGTWTLDVVLQMTKEISNDLDHSGAIDYKDEYGWGGQLDDMWSIFYGSGSKIATTKTADGYPELCMYSERSSSVMDKLQSLVQDDLHYVSANDYFGVAQWPTVLLQDNFIGGHSLFYNGSMATPIELGEMDDAYGLLPIPKGDDTQDGYYSLVNPWTSTCFAVPMSLPEKDYELVADLFNVMGAVSKNLVAPAYLNQCLEYMKTRDDDTIDMIENYILPGRGCDVGMIFAWGGLDELLHQMASNAPGTFRSSYEAKSASAQAALDETVAQFKSQSQN